MPTDRSGLIASTALGLALFAAAPHAKAAPQPAKDEWNAGEIIVVAQRRAERLQDVPISITALTADGLAKAGVTNSIDLQMVTPGLQMASTGVYVQPAIRGISSSTAAPASENNVAVYVDGAYQQSSRASIFDLPDVESVEVLKGPQGTLFGRNATGGAILVNTLAPDLTGLRVKGYVSYGNFGSVLVKGFVSAPIIKDKLSFSLSGLYDHTDGWMHNVADNNRREGGSISGKVIRAKLRFLPWDGADFTLTGVYDQRHDNSVSKLSVFNNNTIARVLAPGVAYADQPWEYRADYPGYIARIQKGVTFHGDIEAGPGKISTTTYYDNNRSNGASDLDNGPGTTAIAAYPSKTRNFEQEILYTTNQIGRFRAVAGLFYYDLRAHSGLNLGNYTLTLYGLDTAKSEAAFGEATYDVTDKLSITGGVRYTREHRTSDASTARNTPIMAPYVHVGSHTWHAVTPKVSVLYKVTDRTNVYGVFSKGFTSGQYNTTSFQATPVNPEKIKAFEVGVKSNEIHNLSFTAAAFHYNYTDLQVYTLNQFGNVLSITLSNAARAKIYGGEVGGTWHVSDQFDVTAGGSYVHARYSNFPAAQLQLPTGRGGNAAVAQDASGETMIRSPTWTGNLTAHYHVDTSRGAFDASALATYSSRIFYEFSNRVNQKPYTMINANLFWTPADSHLKLGIWGKNLSNKAVISTASISNSGDFVNYLPPRTFGVSMQYDY